MKGKLYIVSTPIGNLEDVTFRAIRILNECDYLLAESSERSSKILQKYNISKKIVTFNKDNEKNKVISQRVVKLLLYLTLVLHLSRIQHLN